MVLMPPAEPFWTNFGTAVSQDGVHVFGYGHTHGAGNSSYRPWRWSPPYTSGMLLDVAGNSCDSGRVIAAVQIPDGRFVAGGYFKTDPSMYDLFDQRGWTISAAGAPSGYCVSVPSWTYVSVLSISNSGRVQVGNLRNFDGFSYMDGTFVWQGNPGGAGTSTAFDLQAGPDRVAKVGAEGTRVFGTTAGALKRWPVVPPGLGPPETFALPQGFSFVTVTAVNGAGTACFGRMNGPGGNELYWWREGRGFEVLRTYLPSMGVNLGTWTLHGVNACAADGLTIGGEGARAGFGTEGYVLGLPRCGTADYDGDGDTGTDQDIEVFFECLAGDCSRTTFPGGSDFNRDGDAGTDGDIESFFRVLAGGAC
jgi:hypothetical protein